MQKKQLLFLCPNIFGLYDVFKTGLENYSGCEVTTILYRRYKYKNKKEQIQNFLSKALSGKKLKNQWEEEMYLDLLKEHKHFDYALTICPEMLSAPVLQHVQKMADKSVVYYWDGFDHFPNYKQTLPYFDSLFSFDPEDAKKYKLNFITNFYFAENRNTEATLDFFFLSSFDSRYPVLEKIVSLLEKQHMKVSVLQYVNDKKLKLIPKNHLQSFEFITKPISFKETTELMDKARIVLDIQKDIQKGLTFRVFEAMGLGKKLITTNPEIVNYDFYNPNNIFIWTDETETIPESFLNTPYEELSEEIYKKYSQESWVKKILDL